MLDRSGHHRDMFPFRVIQPDMEAFASFLAIGKVLYEQTRCGASIRSRRDRHADERWDLFGLDEIALAGIRQTIAFERHDALIPAPLARQIEGQRQIAFPEQRMKRWVRTQLGQAIGVEIDIAAQIAVLVVASEKA